MCSKCDRSGPEIQFDRSTPSSRSTGTPLTKPTLEKNSHAGAGEPQHMPEHRPKLRKPIASGSRQS
eukprot:15459977-Alexandrium_andersonii.AAC.1